MDWLWHSLAIVLIVEGVGPLLFPNRWQQYLRRIANEPVHSVRQMGMVLVGAGLLLMIWLQNS